MSWKGLQDGVNENSTQGVFEIAQLPKINELLDSLAIWETGEKENNKNDKSSHAGES